MSSQGLCPYLAPEIGVFLRKTPRSIKMYAAAGKVERAGGQQISCDLLCTSRKKIKMVYTSSKHGSTQECPILGFKSLQ